MRKKIYLILMLVYLLIGCTQLPVNYEKKESYTHIDKKNEDAKSKVYILDNGVDAFVARAALAKKAEKTIDVQYYLYHFDLLGVLFSEKLKEAADRGVRVRILIDDMGMNSKEQDNTALLLNEYPNIEVRIFNPFSRKIGRISQFIGSEHQVTRRMHNKSFTIDGKITILGGRNIGDEYFNADKEMTFVDVDVIGIGKVAEDVSGSFDEYWNNELSYPIEALIKKPLTEKEKSKLLSKVTKYLKSEENKVYSKALTESELAKKIHNNNIDYKSGNTYVLYDNPDKLSVDIGDKKYNLSIQLKPYLTEIKEELIIYSPYFVPGKIGTSFLVNLVKEGVKVKILTNSLASNDVGIVHSGYEKYRKDLLKGGVELYEMNKKVTYNGKKKKKIGDSKVSLHAKVFILDKEKVFVGSLNLDQRSISHNTEIGVIIESPELAENMTSDFDEKIKKVAFKLELVDGKIKWYGVVDGEEKVFDVEPYTSLWERSYIKLLGLLPIESQL